MPEKESFIVNYYVVLAVNALAVPLWALVVFSLKLGWFSNISMMLFVIFTGIGIWLSQTHESIAPTPFNEDGSPPRGWLYHEDTGEFFKVLFSKGGYSNSEVVPYERRLSYKISLLENLQKPKMALKIFGAVALIICLILIVDPRVTGNWHYDDIIAFAGNVATLCYAGYFILWAKARTDFENYDLGPEPIQPHLDGFGPKTPTTPTHYETDGLDYRPNS